MHRQPIINGDLSEYLKKTYSDIIHYENGGDQIDLKIFFQRHLHKNINFIDNAETWHKLKAKYPIECLDIKKTYFTKYGERQFLNFDSLKFYQSHTYITGPKYHDLNDPLFVVKDRENYILWEGYHRLLYKILTNDFNIDCFVIIV